MRDTWEEWVTFLPVELSLKGDRHTKDLSFNPLRWTGWQSSFGGFCELKPLVHSHWMWASCGAFALLGAFGHCGPSQHLSSLIKPCPEGTCGPLCCDSAAGQDTGGIWDAPQSRHRWRSHRSRLDADSILVTMKPAVTEINCNSTKAQKNFCSGRQALVYNNDEWIHKCPPQYEEYFLTQSCCGIKIPLSSACVSQEAESDPFS